MAAVLLLLPAAPALAMAASGTSATRCVPPPVAHRGNSWRAPENTRTAFRSALRGGVRVLEMDVRFTADGVPVLLHDATVDRTTDGSGPVAGMTLAALRALDAGSWFAPRFARVRVPTFFSVLRDGRAYRARYLVELKTRPTPEQLTAFLERMAWLGVPDRVIVNSADPATIEDVRRVAPAQRTAIIDPQFRAPASVLRYGTSYLVAHQSVTAPRALAWRRSGIAVYSWTVDHPGEWRRMAHDRVAGTITSRPVAYLAWARSVCR